METIDKNDIPAEVFLKYLIRDNKELLKKIGEERSYSEELEEIIENLKIELKFSNDSLKVVQTNFNTYKQQHKAYYKSITKEEAYVEIKSEFTEEKKKLKEKIRQLKTKVNQLLYQCGQYQSKIKEYETKS